MRLAPAPAPEALLPIAEVCRRTGCSRSVIYSLIARGAFPAQIHVGAGGRHVSRWIASEVDAWVHQVIADARRTA